MTTFSTINRTIRFNSYDLHISTKQMARYFGGNGYSFPEEEKSKVRGLIHEVLAVIEPTFVYRMRRVVNSDDECKLNFDNGRVLKIPRSEVTPNTRYLAVCACTLGTALDEAINKKSKENDFYDTMLFDAIGVWFLEDLSTKCIAMIRQRAVKKGLYAGYHYGPGYGKMPMEKQRELFSLVDTELIGVSINEALMMRPVKSMSFLVNLSDKPVAKTKKYKCQDCQLETCQFRVEGSKVPGSARRLECRAVL